MANTANPVDMKDADRDDAVLVAVTRDGKFYLGNDPIRLEDVATKVNDLLSGRLDRTVYIRSDFRAKYGDVKSLVDSVRNAGVDKVGLLTERLDDQVRR
jgi:biopolymer transport protein ExbD/biopolymer transport protein TolR